MGSIPNPHQSNAERDRFGFQASAPLTTINKNLSSTSSRINPSLLPPIHSLKSQIPHVVPPDPIQDENAEFEDINLDNDTISKCGFTPHTHSINLPYIQILTKYHLTKTNVWLLLPYKTQQ